MTSKERVLTAIAHREPDRVPLDYLANPGIDRRLKRHFGLRADDDEGLRRALGVDFIEVKIPYAGPRLHADVPDRQVDVWGVRRRWVEHAWGGYWDYCDFPLQDATLDEVNAWPLPSPDDYDYQHVAREARRLKDFCVVLGNPGFGDLINSTGMIRTMEQALIDLATDDPAGLRYMERKSAIELGVMERALDAAAGHVDLVWIGEDLGTQIGPMISRALYHKHLRPKHQAFIDLATRYGLPVMMHSCGSSSWAFDDFIEMGIQVVDTLQPEATDMAPAALKARYGDRLAFHGCISTAGPVAYGSVQETVENVRETLAVMMPGGGYALAPTHLLQDNAPTENVVALYEAAHRYGRYDGEAGRAA